MAKAKNEKPKTFSSKKCPFCSIYLPVHVRRCTSCHEKVGAPDKYGIAKKPVDIKAYVVAAAAIGVFALYIWWAFL